MRRTRSIPAVRAATIASVLVGASTALAAPGIDARALQVPAITQLQRVGVAVVGPRSDETLAARDFAPKSLVRAGHAVAGMPTFGAEPSPARLVASCADHDVDAVALVRISTDATGWRVNVDIRDAAGERIVIGSETRQQQGGYGGGEAA